MQLLAALSGGVDSAVAAARAVDAGHDVTAVHLALSSSPATERTGSRGCCTLEDARDARRVADVLGIPYYVWDLAERFTEEVIDDFVAEYAAGRTPNPCLRCNERIKFAAVLDRAVALGFDAVVTGHHARLEAGVLRRSADADKDQSYVLGTLTAAQLDRAIFPLGESTKSEVRAEAQQRGLGVAAKPDSHDVCFIPDGDTAGWLRGRLGDRPGDIVDADTGERLGGHSGTYAYTVGQRRGLALGTPAADGQPRYVLGIEPVSGTVRVGSAPQLDVDRVQTDAPVWGRTPPTLPVWAWAQFRAHGTPHRVRVERDERGEGLTVTVYPPVRGIAPGQAVVLYGTEVPTPGRAGVIPDIGTAPDTDHAPAPDQEDGMQADVVLGAARVMATARRPVAVGAHGA